MNTYHLLLLFLITILLYKKLFQNLLLISKVYYCRIILYHFLLKKLILEASEFKWVYLKKFLNQGGSRHKFIKGLLSSAYVKKALLKLKINIKNHIELSNHISLYNWRLPSLIGLSPMIFNTGLTHLGSEAFN